MKEIYLCSYTDVDDGQIVSETMAYTNRKEARANLKEIYNNYLELGHLSHTSTKDAFEIVVQGKDNYIIGSVIKVRLFDKYAQQEGNDKLC